MRNLTFCASDDFIAEIDHAVKRVRRANPDGLVSRSGFIKTAIRRAIVDLGADPTSEVRARCREIIAAPVKPVALI